MRAAMGMVFGKVGEETPAFELLQEAASFQVRHYVPSVAAETTYLSAGIDDNTSDAFRRLAQYIGVFSAPQNKNADGQAEPVAMTAPVLMSQPQHAEGAATAGSTPSSAGLDAPLTAGLADGAGRPRTMAFLLPSKYTAVEAAPVPVDSGVTLRQVPSRTQAVSTFTWALNEANVASHLEALIADIEADPEWEPVHTESGDPEWCGEWSTCLRFVPRAHSSIASLLALTRGSRTRTNSGRVQPTLYGAVSANQ